MERQEQGTSTPSAKVRAAFADSLTLVQDEAEADDDLQVPHTVQCFLELLQTLLFEYAIAGITRLPGAPQVASRAADSTTVVQAPLDVLMRYFRGCAQRAQGIPGPRQLVWLTTKAEQERSRRVGVFRNSSMEFGQVGFQVFQQREAVWELQDAEPLPPRKPQAQGRKTAAKVKGVGPLAARAQGREPSCSPCSLPKIPRWLSGLCGVQLPQRLCLEGWLPGKALSGSVCGGHHTGFNHAKRKGKYGRPRS